MNCLSCISITKPLVALASLPTDDSPPPIQTNNPTKPPMHITKPTTSLPKKKQQQQQQQNKQQRRPTIAEIERAIGAGRYRDIDARELKEEEVADFDFMSMSFTGQFEGPVEKKLRETGEWLATSTESRFRASGRKIFMFILQWLLPIWTLSLLMASGVIKLPFGTPFLDDLFM